MQKDKTFEQQGRNYHHGGAEYEEGRAEGEKRARWDMARQMKADGCPVDAIIRYTGISEQDIDAL